LLIFTSPGRITNLQIAISEAHAANWTSRQQPYGSTDGSTEPSVGQIDTWGVVNLPASNDSLARNQDQILETALPKYAHSVQRNAEIYGLDWRLVMAVMSQESKFNSKAVSRRGAYGLMQVMPATGSEVAEKLGYDNLHHPHRNIRGGTFYLASLYDLFEGAPEPDRLRLCLAAYNAGPGRIYDAQELAAYLGENPLSWLSIEKALPLLSKRYYTLHQSVWDGGKPRSGYFGKSRQTILYVRNVLDTYEQYKATLN
jgi:membrane-bound lytic murein transglycosylase F